MANFGRSVIVLALVLAACGADPGSVSITFTWDGGTPSNGVWISGRIMQANPDSQGMGQVISETESPQQYAPGMNLSFADIRNQDNLAILLEARGDSSLESRVLYYGISDTFSLKADESVAVDVAVAMVETPDISGLFIEEAVGPEDCPDCHTSEETVTLRLDGVRAATVEVANDNGFSVCNEVFSVEAPREEMPRLVAADEGWTVEGWELDCGLEDAADGPRSVYVRLLDARGYPSQTLAVQVILDRQPPTSGILGCADGKWLISLETTMHFGVVKADEMLVEACKPGPDEPGSCASTEGGLEPCSSDHEKYLPVNSWSPFTTQACIRLKDDSVTTVQVKYRDFAHNETDWVRFEFENVTQLELAWIPIPGGTFDMGCSPDDTQCYADEAPVHPVTLSPFEILETEVTESQYLAATGVAPSCNLGAFEGGDDFPVECVTWHEASALCEKVGGRLPAEAEWEYAARGGTTTKYYCGGSPGCLDEIAWSKSNSDGHKHEVGGKAPNAYGLYDILGNTFEWTADWYDSSYYSVSPQDNPEGPGSGSKRVFRGGSLYYDHDYLRVSYRNNVAPSYCDPFIGIRCAR